MRVFIRLDCPGTSIGTPKLSRDDLGIIIPTPNRKLEGYRTRKVVFRFG